MSGFRSLSSRKGARSRTHVPHGGILLTAFFQVAKGLNPWEALLCSRSCSTAAIGILSHQWAISSCLACCSGSQARPSRPGYRLLGLVHTEIKVTLASSPPASS